MHEKTIALIVAAGSGIRLGSLVPKQYLSINGLSLLVIAAQKFYLHPQVDAVAVVIDKNHQDLYDQATFDLDLIPLAVGGIERQDSVRNGLSAIAKYQPENVLIHDAARIFVTTELISQLLKELKYNEAVIPVYPIKDSLKYINEDLIIEKNVSRETIFGAQTPQAFKYQQILEAHYKYQGKNYTDDASLLAEEGIPVKVIVTDNSNFKITTNEDLILANLLLGKSHEK